MSSPAIACCLFDMDGLLLDTGKAPRHPFHASWAGVPDLMFRGYLSCSMSLETSYTVAQQQICQRFGKEFTWALKVGTWALNLGGSHGLSKWGRGGHMGTQIEGHHSHEDDMVEASDSGTLLDASSRFTDLSLG